MLQPNDLAIAPRSGLVYFSGGNFRNLTGTTVVGDGDLWLCKAESGSSSSSKELTESVEAVRLGIFGITNGIEVSPDEKSLYLSGTFRDEGVRVNNIFKFSIYPLTGKIYDNQFVVRVGPGKAPEVLKVSSKGKVLTRIKTPEISEPTNVDLGGPDGKSLYIVGKCANDDTKGCVNVWQNSCPGRAFTDLSATGYF